MQIKKVPVNMLHMAIYNPRKDLQPADTEYKKLKKSIEQFGYVEPIIWNEQTGNVVGGHQRLKILLAQGETEVDVSVVNLEPVEEKALNIALNKISGEWDNEKLEQLLADISAVEDFDASLTGFDMEEIENIIADTEAVYFRDKLEPGGSGILVNSFVVPPFSVFDTRQGYWQDRKRYWIDYGIKSEVGREENLVFAKNLNLSDKVKGTSIFDPVICEIIYKWFNVDGGSIIDPFAGGSVRGIVAAITGHGYMGIDLREEQVKSNFENAQEIGIESDSLKWICDNSLNVDKYVEDKQCDMLFTCPPYYDLEVYSDNPEDISNMEYQEFVKTYSEILIKSAKKVKDNRFATVVISDVRDKKGFYRDLTGLTKAAMEKSGFHFYNEIIILNTVGSGAWRCRGNMRNRKVVRIHQNLLVFYKGDPREIQIVFPELKVEDEKMEEAEECQ